MTASAESIAELDAIARFVPAQSVTARRLRGARVLLSAARYRRPKGVDVETVHGSHDGRPVEVEIYRREGSVATLPALVWIHGGGLVMGTHHDVFLCSPYVKKLDLAVVSVKYALAPEQPFPHALDDLVAAYGWLATHGAEHGIDTSRIGIGGASAGGGLTAAVVQRLHDEGVDVACQLMVYPMLDDRSALRDDIGPRENLLWTKESNHFGWSAYLGHAPGTDDDRPYSVPARRDDLSGLAPAWIGVGTRDLFHDEDVEYASRLSAAGVECELMAVVGGFHGFDALAEKSAASRAFRESQRAFLARHLVGALPDKP